MQRLNIPTQKASHIFFMGLYKVLVIYMWANGEKIYIKWNKKTVCYLLSVPWNGQHKLCLFSQRFTFSLQSFPDLHDIYL